MKKRYCEPNSIVHVLCGNCALLQGTNGTFYKNEKEYAIPTSNSGDVGDGDARTTSTGTFDDIW